MSPTFVSIPISTNPDADFDAFVEHMQAAFPGWEAAEGNLEAWLARWWALAKVDLAELAADVPAEIFRKFGEEIIGVAPIAAARASAPSTWQMIDTAGYTIPAGTVVSIALTGDEAFDFEVLEAVTVPPGTNETDDGEVVLIALNAGADANGLSADPVLVDALVGIDSIALTADTSGGVDEESAGAYLDRLVAELRLLTPRPILPADVATLARRVPGVARALALDGYDPGTDTYSHERTVSVALMDAAGVPVSAPVKAEVEALLESMREINFVFNAIDPTQTADNTIKVSATVKAVAVADVDPVGLEQAITSTLENYLSALSWGRSPFDSDLSVWIDQTTVRRNELIAVVDNVEGVDYVSALTLAREADALGSSDVVLEGPAGVPAAGTISITVNP
jgi:uncharacterized phage protein gp47/JayE